MTDARRWVVVVALAAVGCGDRAPPALWPEPPPPSLADPIGVDRDGRAPDPAATRDGEAATGGAAPAPARDAGADSEGSSSKGADEPAPAEPAEPTAAAREPAAKQTGGAARRP